VIFELRDYQKRWCRKTADAFTKGVNGQRFTRVMGTAATGAGKTIMGSAMIWWANKAHNRRALFLADTDELVEQAATKLVKSTGLIPGIEKAESYAGLKTPNVVASIQSIGQPKRLERFPADHFGLVLADEAHLSMADSWQRVLKRFNDAGAWVLGVTATPERGDERDLWSFYEHLSDEIGLFELIDAGHLAPITVETVPLAIDCTTTKITGSYSDDGNDMEEAIEPYWRAIIQEWKQRAGTRPTLFFHPGIRASKRFTALLQEAGVSAKHVDGNSSDRKAILAEFERGDFQALNNAQMLMKGYDCPRISCVVVLRPTQSRVAYQQMIGRGTRKADNFADLLVLDFLWQFSERMQPQGPADLVTRNPQHRAEIAGRIARGDALDLGETARDAEREREQGIIERLKEMARRHRALRFDARDLGAILHQPELIDYTPTARWEHEPPSAKQISTMEKFGIATEAIQTRGEATAIISVLMQRYEEGKASAKQVGALASMGIEAPHELSFADASMHLDELLGSRR
jgi:superfamily II DNA or RNA helicase